MLRRKTKEGPVNVRAKLSWSVRDDVTSASTETPRQCAKENHPYARFEGPLPHITLHIEGVGFLELRPKDVTSLIEAANQGLDRLFVARVAEIEVK
jgi:hypothetical protein